MGRATAWTLIVVVALVTAVATLGITFMVQSASSGGGYGAQAEGAGAADQAPQGMPPAKVRLGVARLDNVQNRFEVIGRLVEVHRTTVAAEVDGKIVAVPAEEGDAVEAGKTVLARIDDVWAKLDLAAAEADVQAAKATLDQSQRDLSYLDALLASGSAKPKEVEDMRARVQSRQAELDAAIATRDRARQRVDRLSVLAPIDGVVIRKLTEVGQWVTQGDAVAEVISRGQIDAVVDVPESLINHVAMGDEVRVLIDALGQHVMGKVVAITPFGSNSARTFPVQVRLDDQQGKLKAGMSVTALLPMAEQSEQLTVPRDAVLSSSNGSVIWVAADGAGPMPVATQVPVEQLFGEGERYVVRPLPGPSESALHDGSKVVIEGAERLMPSQSLLIVGNPLAAVGAEPRTDD